MPYNDAPSKTRLVDASNSMDKEDYHRRVYGGEESGAYSRRCNDGDGPVLICKSC